MRATVTLDEDVERLLRHAIHRSRCGFKEALNAVVHTTDMDFARFANLRWLNPISGAGSFSRRLAKGARNRQASRT